MFRIVIEEGESEERFIHIYPGLAEEEKCSRIDLKVWDFNKDALFLFIKIWDFKCSATIWEKRIKKSKTGFLCTSSECSGIKYREARFIYLNYINPGKSPDKKYLHILHRKCQELHHKQFLLQQRTWRFVIQIRINPCPMERAASMNDHSVFGTFNICSHASKIFDP